MDLQTPVVELRKSSRTIKLLEKYSPTLYQILLTDKGKPEIYEEAQRVNQMEISHER